VIDVPAHDSSSTAGFPITGFFLAMTTAGVLLLATLAVAGMWIPVTWWRALAMVGAALLVCLMVLFFGPTKLIPMASAGVVPATQRMGLSVEVLGRGPQSQNVLDGRI
jgi:hypothetical protein